jgi:hypothetical protein
VLVVAEAIRRLTGATSANQAQPRAAAGV